MLWTVFYTGCVYPPDGGDSYSCICANEMHGSHDIAKARIEASKFGTGVVAMIPGCHMEKSFLFDRRYEGGTKPFVMSHSKGKSTAG